MADTRRIADVGDGNVGPLTYFPTSNPDGRTGLLHTDRHTWSPPRFHFLDKAREVYAPSKHPVTGEAALLKWRARQVQKRWLSAAHPEASMSNSAVGDSFSKESAIAREANLDMASRELLAVGEMTDKRAHEDKALPLLAMACGHSGELLRLVRLRDARWRPRQDQGITFRVPFIKNAEDQVIYQNDALPLTRIKFATSPSSGSLRWLFVQSGSSTVVLQPEYLGEAVADQDELEGSMSHISPKPILTVSTQQTGGSAHSDVVLIPRSSREEPLRVVIIDEAGYWTVWTIDKRERDGGQTFQTSLYRRGHVGDGWVDEAPQPPSTIGQQHGLLYIGVPASAKVYEQSLPPRQLLVWNSERLELFDLASDARLDIAKSLVTRKWKYLRILDVLMSPLHHDELFVLTTQDIYWLNISEYDQESGQGPTVLRCTHALQGTTNLKLVACHASEDAQSVFLVVHAPNKTHVDGYWFSRNPQNGQPHWHRQIVCLPEASRRAAAFTAQHFVFQPITVARQQQNEVLPRKGKEQFFLVNMLTHDLGLRQAIGTSFTDPADLSLVNAVLAGLGKQRIERLPSSISSSLADKTGDIFAICNTIPETCAQTPLAGFRRLTAGKTQQSQGPRHLNIARLRSAIQSNLERIPDKSATLITASLLDAIRKVFDAGVIGGRLPLVTWLEIASESNEHHHLAETLEDPDGMFEELRDELGEYMFVNEPGVPDQAIFC